MKRIVAYPERCMACKACEIACALAHADTEDLVQAILERSAKPRIYVEAAGGLAVPLQCRHCEDAPCMSVCPSGALSRSSGSEPVTVDQQRCIGCAYCVEACPFGVIMLARNQAASTNDSGTAVVKCDLCGDRQAEGLQPACVSACPCAALAFEDDAHHAKRNRAKAAAKAAAFASDQGK